MRLWTKLFAVLMAPELVRILLAWCRHGSTKYRWYIL